MTFEFSYSKRKSPHILFSTYFQGLNFKSMEDPNLRTIRQSIGKLEDVVEGILRSSAWTRDAAEQVKVQVENYARFVYNQTYENIGGCKPLYNVMTSTLHVFSYKLGSPIGTYWFSLNILLFLFYPIVITAIITLRL